MLVKLRQLRALGLIAVASFAIVMSSCRMGEITKNCDGDEECHPNAKICHNPTMHALASDLDHLEAHIDKYGSVVAMQPSVWGQARLTKYRDEFEKEMAKDLTKFNVTLQGSVSRSDQAYLASATAISAAISGSKAYYAPAPSVAVQTNTTALTPITVPDATLDSGVFKGFDAIKRNDPRMGAQLGFPSFAAAGVSLEPTIVLSQKERYLNHLNQIRRNNEGDDTADSPGYSLNLVRIPVSILPGKCTMKGYGAEITMTLTPHISDELLPTTFRQLVLNDLVDLLALPLTKVYDSGDGDKLALLFREIDQLESELKQRDEASSNLIEGRVNLALAMSSKLLKNADGKYKERDFKLLFDPKTRNKLLGQIPASVKTDFQTFMKETEVIEKKLAAHERAKPLDPAKQKKLESKYSEVWERLESNLVSGLRQRVALLPFPPSQIATVLGREELAKLAKDLFPSTKGHTAGGGRAYILDVRAALHDELNAAFEFIKEDEGLMQDYAPGLATLIRERNDSEIKKQREQFEVENADNPKLKNSTISLAWAIIVESALLNERLKQDTIEAAAAQGKSRGQFGELKFFMPNPGPSEKQAFEEYVKTRWPIHVFAIDPITQDQNLADTYSRRQEMQLALSLAFASGNISARNMTRYARRIEEDMETIAINKTQVGFSHGSDTFGWRFYPRFQTPEFESNATSIIRNQLIGGPSKNEEIRQMRLEPGMRECVAIVMMPSFVPYVKCESSSNWFKLTNPKHKEFTLTDAVRLGKIVKSVQTCSPNIRNENCYRDGDLARLLAKAKQLENRLPLQDTMVQVPYENTLGGFEMFNTGITDLAPQLRGWYGGPGVLDKADTQLFLVGDHFSVHHTIVTAGGKDVSFELISRQIMRVTIPKGTMPNSRKDDSAKPAGTDKPKDDKTPPDFKYVDVHVATPYGVTAHLEIPFVEVASPTDSKTGLDWNANTVEVGYSFEGNSIKPLANVQSWPPLTIKWDVKLLRDPPADGKTFDLDLTFASPYSDASGKAAKTFPAQTIKLSGLAFTVDAKTKEIQVNSALLVNGLFNGAPASGAYSGAPGFGGYFNKGTPPVPIATTKVALTIKDKDGKPLTGSTNPITVGGSLTVIWSPAPGSGSAPPIVVHPVEGPVLFQPPLPHVIVPHEAPAKSEFTWAPPLNPTAKVSINVVKEKKEYKATSFVFEPKLPPLVEILDNVDHTQESGFGEAKLNLKVIAYTTSDDKGKSANFLPIPLNFENRRVQVNLAARADEFTKAITAALNGTEKKAT